jgi:hypothetical protein
MDLIGRIVFAMFCAIGAGLVGLVLGFILTVCTDTCDPTQGRMSEIRFYRVLAWLPLLVPILLAPFWLPRGVDYASGPVYILTVGAGHVAGPPRIA